MKRTDKYIFGLIIGLAFPMLVCLLSVTIWFYFDKNDTRPFIYLISGLIIGLIIDLMFLKAWIINLYNLPFWFMIAIYAIYNVIIYGIFMGFPVINVFLGIIAGYYCGNRICFKNIQVDQQKKTIKQVSLFTGLVMIMICISSGFIALTQIGVESGIKGMLKLSFDINRDMIYGIVFIGGLSLILIQILLTRITMIKTINNKSNLKFL